MSLREWPVRRVVAAWALWLVLAFGGAIATAVLYARGEASSLSAVPAPTAGDAVPHITGGWSVEFGTGGTVLLLLAIVGPPAFLTATWVWQRGDGKRTPSDR